MLRGRRRWKSWIVGMSVAGGVAAAGCLGSDYLSQPASLSEWDHGWRVAIDSDERLDVGLRENPSYPGAEWQIVEVDASALQLEESFRAPSPYDSERPDDRQSLLSTSVFTFTGADTGESPLVFEIRVGDERVDLAEFAVAVVEDACAADLGLTAPRCGDDHLDNQGLRGLTEWDHGWSVPIESGEDLTVTLTANAVYPDVPWQITEYDPSVVEVQDGGPGDVRAAGDWDLSDPEKPESFLPISEFLVTAVGSGESPLVFEVRAGDRQVEVVEYTAVVADDA